LFVAFAIFFAFIGYVVSQILGFEKKRGSWPVFCYECCLCCITDSAFVTQAKLLVNISLTCQTCHANAPAYALLFLDFFFLLIIILHFRVMNWI
jgi:hypothetical protein